MNNKILLIIIFIFYSLSSYAQMFGQEPIERERTYDVQHINIEVKLDLGKKIVEGKTTTTIVPLKENFNEIRVDAVGMKIKEVTLIPKIHLNPVIDGAVVSANVKFEYDKKILTIKLDKNYTQSDTITYIVEYTTTNPEKGMYFIKPDSLHPNKRYEVWTQGEGEDNRYWFPCYDYPNDKATTETYITVDSKYMTLSNGRLEETKVNPDGTKTWHWVLNHPHSSYLVMIAVGNYDVIEDKYEDIPVYSYVPPGTKDMALKSFNQTAKIVKFFSEIIGFKYPWDKVGEVTVQDFIYGGMENSSAVVYFDGAIYDERVPPDYSAIGLVAHEQAHQWWGDVLTCKNWNEIWLNESFATYFQLLYYEFSLGKDEFDYGVMRNGDAAINADSADSRRPIYNREGLTVNTYDKGSVVLNMLRYVIGKENFWKAMNTYINSKKFDNVVTDDLINAVNKTMNAPKPGEIQPDKPAYNYKWFFDEWVYSAGQPEFRVNYDYDETKKEVTLTASQIQRLDTSSVFKTPVEVEIIAKDFKSAEKLEIPYEPKIFTFKVPAKPLSIIFNKGNKVLSRLYFTKPVDVWIYQLENSEDAIDRITAIKGLKDFMNETKVIHSVIHTLQNDKFWGVRNEAAKIIPFTNSTSIVNTVIDMYKIEPDSRVRRSIINAFTDLAQNCSECADKKMLTAFYSDAIKNESSYYAIGESVIALSKIIDKGEIYDLVTPYLNMDSFSDIIRRNTLTALQSSDDKRAIEIFKKYSAANIESRRVRNIAFTGLEKFLNEKTVVDYLNTRLNDKSRENKFNIIRLIEIARNKSSIPALESFLTSTNDDQLKKRVKEVIEKIK